MKTIVIFGATSGIAIACARIWAEQKTVFFLVGRSPEKLRQIADDLTARGSIAHAYTLDLTHIDQHAEMLEACFTTLGKVDIALVAHGTLPDQRACEEHVTLAVKEFINNGLSTIALLSGLANRMETQKSGCIAVISSVAGDRGRPSNYLYGAAKSAVTSYCSGLRGRMHKAGVHVLTVKPGFVDTPMTKGLALPKLLLASPQKVAGDIVTAIDKHRNQIYSPGFWRFIMLIIINIPTSIFKRLSL